MTSFDYYCYSVTLVLWHSGFYSRENFYSMTNRSLESRFFARKKKDCEDGKVSTKIFIGRPERWMIVIRTHGRRAMEKRLAWCFFSFGRVAAFEKLPVRNGNVASAHCKQATSFVCFLFERHSPAVYSSRSPPSCPLHTCFPISSYFLFSSPPPPCSLCRSAPYFFVSSIFVHIIVITQRRLAV